MVSKPNKANFMKPLQDIEKLDEINDKVLTQPLPTVFSNAREKRNYEPALPPDKLPANAKIKMDGLKFLNYLPSDCASAAFFDPQFRGVYDKMKYGNEATSRNNVRVKLPQMSEDLIVIFVNEISRVLVPSGHLFLWMDKFHLCSDFQNWCNGTRLTVVDLITWDKGRIGLGYRTRHRSEFCMILQKEPRRAKGVWTLRNIPDVWQEKITEKTHPHNKPIQLQSKLIEAVTAPGDLVIDPAAGSFSVMEACNFIGRKFLGCDIKG